MKILLITSELDRGGAETHVCDLARALSARGHQIVVVSAGGAMVSRLTDVGIRHGTLKWNTHHPIRLWVARGRLIRMLKRERYDLIHAHGRLPAYLVAGAAKRRGIPLVTTVHARFRVGAVTRRLSRWGDRTIAVSRDLADYARREYSLPPEQLSVIPNGIDPTVFAPISSDEKDKLRVLFFSRLDKDCSLGAQLLCALAERLRERFPTVEIWIIGGGEMLPSLRREAELLHCRNPTVPLKLWGHLEHPETLLPHAQAVVAVSRCALEAMACGVSVILGGNEGFLGVAEGDRLARGAESNFCCRGEGQMTEEGLFSALCDLLSRPRRERAALGETLRSYVRKHHSTETMAWETERVYQRALGESEPKQRKGILLCGYYGYGNMGDDALLDAAICRARKEFPSLPVLALAKGGTHTGARFGIPCYRRSSPVAILRAMKRSSALVFGGGTLLQDHTSLRSLLYYAFLLRLAQHKGLKTVLWGNGLDEPRSVLGAGIMRWALVGCDFLGLRDEPSMAVAKELLGVNCVIPMRKERDLVLAYPPLDSKEKDIRSRLGLSQEGGALAVIAPKGNEGQGMIKLLLEWGATLRGEGILPVIVPMFPKEDGGVCNRLCRELSGVLAEGLTPSELIGLMKDSRIVCGMRLHALVFASLVKTPFVGFGSDSKVEAFCREHGGIYFTDLYK